MVKILVDVFEAKNVKGADDGGKSSDPYVKVEFTGIKKMDRNKTATCFKTLNPVWNAHFEFDVPTLGRIDFDVFDKDKIGKDDKIGNAFVNLMEFAPDVPQHLILPLKYGTIRVQVTVVGVNPREYLHPGYLAINGPLVLPHFKNLTIRTKTPSGFNPFKVSFQVSDLDFGDQDIFQIRPYMTHVEVQDLAENVLLYAQFKFLSTAIDLQYGGHYGPICTKLDMRNTGTVSGAPAGHYFQSRNFQCQIPADPLKPAGTKYRIEMTSKWLRRKFEVHDRTRNQILAKFKRDNDEMEGFKIMVWPGADLILIAMMIGLVNLFRWNEINRAKNEGYSEPFFGKPISHSAGYGGQAPPQQLSATAMANAAFGTNMRF